MTPVKHEMALIQAISIVTEIDTTNITSYDKDLDLYFCCPDVKCVRDGFK